MDNNAHHHHHHHHRSSRNRAFHKSTVLGLNRFLFDPCEVDSPSTATAATTTTTTTIGAPSSEKMMMDAVTNNDDNRSKSGRTYDDSGDGIPTVTLPKNDYRTIHAAKILGLLNGDTLRAGIVQDRNSGLDGSSPSSSCVGVSNRNNGPEKKPQSHTKSNDRQNLAGLVTDQASVEWLPEGKIKKAQPTKKGEPPGSLRITLHSLISPDRLEQHDDGSEDNTDTTTTTKTSSDPNDNTPPPSPHVSLILAVPRPLGLSRLLPMISQLGVDHIVLTAARKVPKDYFGSHLLREPQEVRRLLIEGLCQAGDVKIPKVTIVKRLKVFLEDDFEAMFPTTGGVDSGGSGWTRVIAHPQRKRDDSDGDGDGDDDLVQVRRMRDVILADNDGSDNRTIKNIVLAVGPEGGWEEPYELDMFRRFGFEQITLGPRILRTDVAVVSLLSLAHDSLSAMGDDC